MSGYRKAASLLLKSTASYNQTALSSQFLCQEQQWGWKYIVMLSSPIIQWRVWSGVWHVAYVNRGCIVNAALSGGCWKLHNMSAIGMTDEKWRLISLGTVNAANSSRALTHSDTQTYNTPRWPLCPRVLEHPSLEHIHTLLCIYIHTCL